MAATPISLQLHHYRPPSSTEDAHPKSTATTTSGSSRLNNAIQTHPCLVSLEKCSSMSELKQIHAQMLRTGLFFDPFTASKIVAFCALEDSGSLQYAHLVLSQIPDPTTYTCNSIIRGYTNKNSPHEALVFYKEVISEGFVADKFTFPSLFKSCEDLRQGKQLHCQSIKLGFASDLYTQNTLINMYSHCGCLIFAQNLFEEMRYRSVVSWATMIGAYAQWGRPDRAIKLFERMEIEEMKPNEITLINVLTACAQLRDLDTAKWVHSYIDESGIGFHLVLTAALMDVYCKCGSVSLARDLFNNMPEKNLFCWNIMINGHVEDSDYEEALLLFRDMQLKGVKGDKVTMAILLHACTRLGTLELGRWIHTYIKKERIEVDVALGTALVDMYARCGSIESSLSVFQEMPERDVMTWTALIVGLAMSVQGEKALEIFHEMEMSGTKPDAITFVGVLAACSHAGLLDQGLSYFNYMSDKYGIQPTLEHYGCMVDMLGRGGHIAKAEELIQHMPMAPDSFVLGGLLRACRIHGHLETAEKVAQQLLELDADNGGTCVLLSDIYRSRGKARGA